MSAFRFIVEVTQSLSLEVEADSWAEGQEMALDAAREADLNDWSTQTMDAYTDDEEPVR